MAALTHVLPPALRRLAQGRHRLVVFVAACPACGGDALWRSEATDADPRPTVKIRCARCDLTCAEVPSGTCA